MKTIFVIGLSYFLVYWCYYSAYNYMLMIISYKTNLTPKQYSFLDILQIVEFIGGFMWTNLADRTSKHKPIMIIGLLGYALSLSAFRFAPDCCKVDGLNFFAFLYKIMCSFFGSAIFATLDAFCLEKLANNKQSYGKVRIFACIGQFFAHVFLRFFDFVTKKSFQNGTSSIIVTNITAIICSLHMLVFLKKHKVEKQKKINVSLKEKVMKNVGYVKHLLQLNFVLLLTTIFLQGIHRRTVASYLELYYQKNNITKSKIYVAFAMRSVPEICLFFYTKQIQNLVGIYWMHFASIFFGVIRPITYALIDLTRFSIHKQDIFMYLLEMTNGMFSAFFYYSSIQIANKIASTKTQYLAQGLIYGSYNGLAPCMSGILGYCLLQKDFIKYKNDDIRGLFLTTGILGCLGFVVFSVCVFRQNRIKVK